MNSQFIEGILEINTKYFFKFKDEDELKYRVISGYVFCYAAEMVYNKLVREKEIEPLESLPQDKKEKYWELANTFCADRSNDDKIKASKAAYILELITSTF